MMSEFTEYRGVDLTRRKKKIEAAMNLTPPEIPEDVPIIANTPCYFGFGCNPMPQGYWDDPAVMLRFQQDGAERHLRDVEDDTVPYFMPWFGTGVLASAFGCEIRPATGDGDDPGVVSSVLREPGDIVRLRMPDPNRDGWMPRVQRFMEYAARHGELPVGFTDLNSPLCTAAQLCGYDNLFIWMYEEPEAVHELMALLCETFADWVRVQKQYTAEPFGRSNGLQGVWSPKGGIWMSDDDLVSVGAELYAEFVLPHYSELFEEFGGGHLHFCGVGTHQLDNIAAMKGLTAVNNSPMANNAAFNSLVRGLGGKLAIEIQDAAPDEPEAYYSRLFQGFGRKGLTGVMVATFVEDRLAMDGDGRTIFVERDAIGAANRLVRAVRAAVAAELVG
jgi:hypothetical protein